MRRMSIPLPEQLQTPRLHLRKPRLEDAPAIYEAYTQDAAVCRYMVWRPHTALAHTQAFVAACIQAWDGSTHRPYVLTHSSAQTAVGMLEARHRQGGLDLGYVLARPLWGQGLMPEAIAVLTDAALATAAIYRVQASCDVDNTASQRALEKAGFMAEGLLHRYAVHPNISPVPRACYMYAKCR